MITFTAILTLALDMAYVVYCIRKELNHEPIKQIDLITCIILLMVSIVMGIALT